MKIYFTSGKVEEFEIDEREYNAMINRLKDKGVRLLALPNGNFVPLNSNTIELIDTGGMNKRVVRPVEPPTLEQQIETVKEEIAQTKETLASELGEQDRDNPSATQEQEPKVLSGVEKERKILEEITAKSNCTHQGDNLKLFSVSGKKGTRYYFLCTFCGYRSKFIKAESLTEDEKKTAIAS